MAKKADLFGKFKGDFETRPLCGRGSIGGGRWCTTNLMSNKITTNHKLINSMNFVTSDTRAGGSVKGSILGLLP